MISDSLKAEALTAAATVVTDCAFDTDPPTLERLRLGLAIAWCEGRQAGLKVGEAIYNEALAELRADL